jgi:hypothetical protein
MGQWVAPKFPEAAKWLRTILDALDAVGEAATRSVNTKAQRWYSHERHLFGTRFGGAAAKSGRWRGATNWFVKRKKTAQGAAG